MKKSFILFLGLVLVSMTNAQIVYQTVYTDNFETTDGYPANFVVKAQQAWTAVHTTNNPYPYTGTLWKDMYSDVKPATKKTYAVSAYAENRTGGTGTQCLKFDIKNESFTDMTPYDTVRVVRWRGADGKLSFNTATGEGITKYEVTFWAKTDGDNKDVLINTKDPLTKLTLTSNWQKFVIERYVTGTSSTALGIDFYNTLYPAVDNSTGYSVYMDEFTIKQRKIAYTSAATSISTNGFTANWAAVEGANSYNLIVEKTDGTTTPTWTPVVGSPFSVGNATTFAVTGLDTGGTYRYRVTATDGTVTTVESNNIFATTLASGLENHSYISISVLDNKIRVSTEAGNEISIYNINGQLLHKQIAKDEMWEFKSSNKGVYFVKINNYIRKIII